jgi:sugar O-acyltransferase (sialic acid O-acetyltransferase NeuD family)
MKHIIGVYGAGGCGRGILPLLRQAHPSANLVFVDDERADSKVNGQAVLTWANFTQQSVDRRHICLAVASPVTREKLARKCDNAGIELIGVNANSIVVMDDVEIGEGACLSPFVTLTSNIRIGRCFHANLYSYIEHDCRVGDYVTLAPGAKINGNVTLGNRVYIGASAVVRQGLKIGSDAIIGMGAVVTRDVADGVTVVGNPARPLNKDK